MLSTPIIIGGDNIYVKKTCKRLESQNEHSDIANKYSSSLKMTHVSRNM